MRAVLDFLGGQMVTVGKGRSFNALVVIVVMIGDLCHSSSDFRIKRPAETKQARTIVDQTIFANNVYGEKEIL